MSYSQITDERKRTISQIHYEYDSFGRRILSQDSVSSASRTMYDGLSFDTIKIAPVHPNGRYTDYAVEGRQYQSGEFVQESETDRYFHISDDDAGGRGSRIGDSDSGYNFVSEFDGAERVYISLGGTPVAVSQLSDGIASSRGVSYYGTDSQGSVRSETDWYGELKDSYSYDVMGSCVCDGAMPEFGYCGKRQGKLTGLYDYGFRDYAPSVGRFTTVDPVRDGVNWFGYCGGDAVNWVDLWGLEEKNIDPNGYIKWKAAEDCKRITEINRARNSREARGTTPYNFNNLSNQKEFDYIYGFYKYGDSTVSCKTNALINLYAEKHGITPQQLDNAVSKWKEIGAIANDGAPQMLNDMSAILAKELGLNGYYSLVCTAETPNGIRLSPQEFENSEYDYGIQYKTKPGKDKDVFNHYTTAIKDGDEGRVLDSLDPNRPGADLYTVKTVQPLKFIKFK